MVLPSPAPRPPIATVESDVPIPPSKFPRGAVPEMSVPMRLPRMVEAVQKESETPLALPLIRLPCPARDPPTMTEEFWQLIPREFGSRSVPAASVPM